MTDVLFISPDSSREVYQSLAPKYSAIEPPVWAVLLATHLRRDGFDVGILDPLAEGLSDHEAWIRIANAHPKLICFVVYGQNPNSGTTNMAGAVRLARYIRTLDAATPIAIIGSHASALPQETLDLDNGRLFDYVLPGDGYWALHDMIRGARISLTPPRRIIWAKPYDDFSARYDWSLLPTLDHYRCHTWHNNFDPHTRSPFAAIYTSLGCPFKCDFCMINMVNRESESQQDAAQASGIRYFHPQDVLATLEGLADMGVRNVRLSDEMFFLNKQHYTPILTGVINRKLDLNMWAYARVDTVRPEYLELFKRAGVNWLCLGIEAANPVIRREITKGSFETVDVRQVVKEIKAAGINVLANFIFGLPDESEKEMQETLNLALELKAEHTNFYPCMALPGSPLYRTAILSGTPLPSTFEGYSFHSYECLPLPTKTLSAGQVVAFRDKAWQTVTTNEDYLSMIDHKFGSNAANAIMRQSQIPLRRKILES